jgi:hypothetical protein
MVTGSQRRSSVVALALVSVLALPATAVAQIPGDNVNMVTGTDWPGGDPFLQRQNEPSIAVSSANPQHLLAGANDYRSVDVPFPASINKMPGDAWLGLFKSYNGGLTWQSVLLPGFPQDNSPAGAAPGMKTCGAGNCTSAADPVIRAGPDGMLYYSGIKFVRGTTNGKVFVARFIDLNNKENGDPTKAATDAAGLPTIATPTDPIRYIDQIDITREIDPGTPDGGSFLDKPWFAVDRPRAGATCPITVQGPDGTPVTRSVAAGALYVAYVRFAPLEASSDILFRSSTDCGLNWSAPIKLNDAASTLNQGPSIAIDPISGTVYVTWRRIRFPAAPAPATQGDAIMVARSFHGAAFTKARVLAPFKPFEQGSTPSMFRTNAFPSIAISVDKAGAKSWAHIVWAQRQGPYNEGHVVMSTTQVYPAPASGKESDDSCGGWNTPSAVDDVGLTDDTMKRVFNRGHQFMPTVTFSQGRLMVFYYDSRLDHTAGEFLPNMVNGVFQPDALGRFYREERVPIAIYNPATGKNDPPESPTNVFALPNIDDATMKKVRHTVEVRVGGASPGPAPVFSSVQVSKFRFGERGNEPAVLSAQTFHDADPLSLEPDPRKWLPVTDGKKFVRLQQFDVNTPNLPLFKNGEVPFVGDYVDIQGSAFVRKNGTWAFNTDPTSSPVFHAVWTTNQDVRAPLPGTTWKDFTPMKLPSGQSVFDGTIDTSKPATFCSPGTAGNEGIRNQNIYTSRITEGLHVSSPQNVKPLYIAQNTSFVVSVYNDTGTTRSLRFSFTGAPPTDCAVPAGTTPSTACASFRPDALLDHVDADVLPHSSVSRSLFVRSANPDLPIVVSVTELTVQAPCTVNKCSCPPATIGLSGQLILNPPGSNPSSLVLAPPDGSTAVGPGSPEQVGAANVATANVATANVATSSVPAANIATANVATANVATANVATANVATANVATANLATANVATSSVPAANIATANVATANVATANVATANVATANVATANIATANVATANVATANVATANVATANVATANVATANVATASISDLNYQVTNTGNTTTSYTAQFVCTDPAGCASLTTTPIKLMVNKFYLVASTSGCQLIGEPRPVLVSNGGLIQDRFIDPASNVNPNTADGSAGNATLTLAPGESAQVTLRAAITLGEMAKIGARIAPAVVPHSLPVVPGRTYASTTLSGFPTITTVNVTPGVFQVQVVAGNGGCASNGDGCYRPSGTVTFIQDGSKVVGTAVLNWNGSALFEYSLPAASSTLVAYYGGDTFYNASASASVDRRTSTKALLQIPFSPPSQVGQVVPATITFQTQANVGTPTGTVELLNGTTSLGTTLVTCVTNPYNAIRIDCSGTINVSTLPVGNYVLTGRYNGDGAFAPSASAPQAWNVVPTLGLNVQSQLGWIGSSITVRLGSSSGMQVSGATVQLVQDGTTLLSYTEDPNQPGSYLSPFTGSFPGGTTLDLLVAWGGKQVTGSVTVPYEPTVTISGSGAVKTGPYYWSPQDWTIYGVGTLPFTMSWSSAPATQPAGTTYQTTGGWFYSGVTQATQASFTISGSATQMYGYFLGLNIWTDMALAGNVDAGSSVSAFRQLPEFNLWVAPPIL